MAGGYQHQPEGIAAIVAEFRKIKKLHDDLSRRITSLGITIDAQGNAIWNHPGRDIIIKGGSNLQVQDDGTATIDGSMDVGGNLNVSGTETVGGTLHVTGDTVIDGTLSLPNASVNNAALANPTAFGRYGGDINTTNFTVAGADVIMGNITVPSGFTSALVTCMINVGNTRNVGAGGQAFYAQAWINGTGGRNGAVIGNSCEDGGSMSISTMVMAMVTGLTGGGSVTMGAWASVNSTSGWTSGAGNAHVDASAVFLR